MPTYDYACPTCGCFDAYRPLAERNAAIQCPVCGADAQRTIIAAPVLTTLSTSARNAHATNERAAHAPKRSSQHGMSCTCCNGPKFPSGASDRPTPLKAPGGRPWMISH